VHFRTKEKKMEQVRLLLAIGLSFLVLFIWSMFFIDQPQVKEQQNAQQQEPLEAEIKSQGEVASDTAIAEKTKVDEKEAADPKGSESNPSREISVKTPFYTVRLSAEGASFTSFILNEYRESVEKNSPKKQLISPQFSDGDVFTSLQQNSVPGLREATFSISSAEDELSIVDSSQPVEFTWVASDGTIFTKTYTFNPDSYLIDLKMSIQNRSEKPLRDQLVLSIRKQLEENSGYGFTGPAALIDGKLVQVKKKKIEDKNIYEGKLHWISVEDRYFLSSIITESEIDAKMKLSETETSVANSLVNPAFEILPGEKKSFQFFVFMGPKNMELLDSIGFDLGKALNFGFFNFIAKPCLWFMNKIHSVIPNYGIAIIILTLFTKILLWPLGNKSYKSMSEMKKLQPLMTEIREKYKDNKQKMNQELMGLYRTYKVNPMGGCLPMILQIPVFFALYRMLYQAIELRHAPFFLWINDLSAPDRLFDFGFSIPFMEPPYGIPVLTIIMGGTMLLQQKMSPPPGDPTQAKMMMLMPIVFTFIFINFSSGLVLYWLVNNLLSISQQYYVQKKSA
jgi:YidC/Oxa1 family membrane protein insertase